VKKAESQSASMQTPSSAGSDAQMAEYRLFPAAERDSEGIWKYTHREGGLEQAERYTDLLTAAFQVLAEAPKPAPACDHIRPGYRRRNVERHMLIFASPTTASRLFASFMSGWTRRIICNACSWRQSAGNSWHGTVSAGRHFGIARGANGN
jgi:toxin ParE1/3/4